MTKPIKPDEVKKIIPDEVIEVFNELIQENWDGRQSYVAQKDAADRIAEKMGISRDVIFEKHYLDIEPIYIAAGWKVNYDKPGFNERPYPESFTFSRP